MWLNWYRKLPSDDEQTIRIKERLMTKPTKWHLHPAKTQIIVGNSTPSLIGVFAVRMKKAWVLSNPLSAQQKLIWLGGCPGWPESSLGALCHSVGFVMRRLTLWHWQEVINPFMPGALFYLCKLDESTSHLRGVWFLLLLLCLNTEISVSNTNNADINQTLLRW